MFWIRWKISVEIPFSNCRPLTDLENSGHKIDKTGLLQPSCQEFFCLFVCFLNQFTILLKVNIYAHIFIYIILLLSDQRVLFNRQNLSYRCKSEYRKEWH